MNEQNEKQLEQLIHRELRKLPELPAPQTLVHRVMLAVHAKEREPWWQRSWWTWPLWAQMTSLATFVACAGLISYLAGAVWGGLNVTSLSTAVSQWLSGYAPIWEALKALFGAVLLVLQKLGQPALFVAGGSLLLVYFLCVGVGTVCFRFAIKRA